MECNSVHLIKYCKYNVEVLVLDLILSFLATLCCVLEEKIVVFTPLLLFDNCIRAKVGHSFYQQLDFKNTDFSNQKNAQYFPDV